jgi:hypothetical protein
MSTFDDTEHFPTFSIPEENNLPLCLPKKGILQPPEIDPALRLKWGLALLGEEKAKEYLAWLLARLDADSP